MRIAYLVIISSCLSCQTVTEWVSPEFLSDLPSLVSNVQSNKKSIQRIQERLDSLERTVNSDIEESLDLLRKDIQSIQSPSVKKKVQKVKKTKSLSLYDKAHQHFKNKEWEQAILVYEEFRKKNPKSKEFKTATLNIGMSFNNLDLKKEASMFFREVIERFPSSSESKIARKNLK